MFLQMFFCCGCSQQSQLHEKFMVRAMTIDLGASEGNCITDRGVGEDNCITVIAQGNDFKNPLGKEEPSVRNVEVSGESLSLALDKLNKITGLKPLYSQNLIIIVGEEAAKRGTEKFMDFFLRYYENRLSTKLRVAKGKASEIFEAKNNGKPIKASTIRSLAEDKTDSDVLKFESDIKSGICDPVTMTLEKNEKGEVICENLAVFSKDSLVCFLNKEETMGSQILSGISKLGAIDITEDKKNFSCNIDKVKTKITPFLNNGNIEFNIETKTSVNILETEEILSSMDDIDKNLKSNINRKITEICKKAIEKTLSLQCDIFKFGKIFRNKYPKYFKNIESSWKDHLKTLKYDLKSETEISVVGMG